MCSDATQVASQAYIYIYFLKSFVSDSLPLSSASFLSLLCLLSPLSHAATTSSDAHQKSTTTGSKAHAKKLNLTNAHQKLNWIRSNKPTSDQIKLHWRIGGWNPWEMVPEIRVHRAPLDFLSLLPRRSATPWPGVGFGWFNIDLMCCWGLFFCFGWDSRKWDDSDKEEVFGVFVLVLLRRGRNNI